MPNWAGSCWYYLRYLDPVNTEAFVDPENEAYWMGPRPEPVPGPRPARVTPVASPSCGSVYGSRSPAQPPPRPRGIDARRFPGWRK